MRVLKTGRQFIAMLAGMFCFAVVPAYAQEADKRPNVLMIATDDLNDFINCLGGYPGKVHTPNLDRLAARGRLFANAHTTVTVCGPSRNAVMLGKGPWTTELYRNLQPWTESKVSTKILSKHFMEAGYYAAGAGKIFHQGPKYNSRAVWNEYHLFDQKHEWTPEGHPINGLDRKKYKMYPTMDWGAMEPESQNGVMYDHVTTRYTVDFLKRKHDKPFFLASGIILPHIPWYAPKKFYDLYPIEEVVLPVVKEDDLADVPAAATRHTALWREDLSAIDAAGKRREAVRGYLACISYVDSLIGEMLDALDSGPNADNTIVIFWSDHGWHLGEKNWWHKFTLWERSTRVPLIIAGPGIEATGATTRPASLLDLYPTLIELCGLSEQSGLEGVSLVPQLRDPKAERKQPAISTFFKGDHAVRSERWRYIRYFDGSEELYDHKNDPNEWTNLASDPQYASVKAEHAKWMPQITGEPHTGGIPNVDYNIKPGKKPKGNKAKGTKHQKKPVEE